MWWMNQNRCIYIWYTFTPTPLPTDGESGPTSNIVFLGPPRVSTTNRTSIRSVNFVGCVTVRHTRYGIFSCNGPHIMHSTILTYAKPHPNCSQMSTKPNHSQVSAEDMATAFLWSCINFWSAVFEVAWRHRQTRTKTITGLPAWLSYKTNILFLFYTAILKCHL